jgi:hypothetical protein
MSWEPNNDLEEAYANAHLGIEETVDYFRLLRESILMFLVPYKPDMRVVQEFGVGKDITFTTFMVQGEVMIPIFTSSARVEEALQATGKWEEKNGVGEMLGKELLHVISMLPDSVKAIVNPDCSCGARVMNQEMVRSIVDGSALEIPTPGEQAMNGLVISLPVRQPAELREPLGKFFATLPEVKAAWLFFEEEPKKPCEKVYVVGLAIAGGDAEEIRKEAALALAGACPPEWGSRAIIMDPKDPGFTDIMRCPSFYRTADYEPPPKETAAS